MNEKEIKIAVEGINAFGRLLAIYRHLANLSQAELAQKLQLLGYDVSVATISRYEAGERSPSASFIPYFAKIVGLSEKEEHILLDAYVDEFRLLALKEYNEGKSNINKDSSEDF